MRSVEKVSSWSSFVAILDQNLLCCLFILILFDALSIGTTFHTVANGTLMQSTLSNKRNQTEEISTSMESKKE